MSGELVSLFTNAAMAGLAVTWVFICLAYYSRRHRPLHIAGALFCALLALIFVLRTMLFAQVGPWNESEMTTTIRVLWLCAVLVWLVYSIVFLIERRGTDGAGKGNHGSADLG